LIFAGLIAVSQDKNITNSLFVMSIAALAGFNWEWIVEQLNRVKENL
jgi:UDP-N-acetylmuramyl pentapeptide synthase